jgi:hypothetical protein
MKQNLNEVGSSAGAPYKRTDLEGNTGQPKTDGTPRDEIRIGQFRSRPIDRVSYRMGVRTHVSFREILSFVEGCPVHRVCLVDQPGDRPEPENFQRARRVVELLAAGAASLALKAEIQRLRDGLNEIADSYLAAPVVQARARALAREI